MKKLLIVFLLLPWFNSMAQDSLLIRGDIALIKKNPKNTWLSFKDYDYIYEPKVYGTVGKLTIRSISGVVGYVGRIDSLKFENATTEAEKATALKKVHNPNYLLSLVTGTTVYPANTYRELYIFPRSGGNYTLTVNGGAAISSISQNLDFKADIGLIGDSVTITPNGGATILIITKK
jgi:hypothetical protein